jgi:hypothetical protein
VAMHLKRLQLSRAKGWRMPAQTRKVDRSTRWGNPFKVGEEAAHPTTRRSTTVATREQAIELFALYLGSPAGQPTATAARAELRGYNLACWCKAGLASHADVLLRIANGPTARRAA